MTAQEEERRRIARDLHDDVGQRLSLLAIGAEALRGRAARPGERLDERARELAVSAQELASDVHRIAYELHPARLEHLGLAAAIRRLAAELRERHELGVTLTETDWPAHVPLPVALCLYRVTQEALWNVVRHSGSREARVALEGHPDHLALTIADGGAGFEAGAGRADGGLGLAGMRERLRLAGGTLTIDAAPGRGTRIQGRVPRETRIPGAVDDRPEPDHAEAARPAR
jgi:signal transduction histidine kinase